MMKKVFSVLGGIFSAVIIVAIVFAIGFVIGKNKSEPKWETVEEDTDDDFDLKLPGEVEKRVVTVEEVEAKLVEAAELTTYSGEYTVTLGKDEARYVFDKLTIPGSTNSIELTASGIVKVGFDMNDVTVKIDDDTIYIAIPNLQVNDNYVIWDTVSCDETNTPFNPIEFSQYQEIISEMEEMGLDQVEGYGIYDKAEENAEKVMNGFLSEFTDYQIVYM